MKFLYTALVAALAAGSSEALTGKRRLTKTSLADKKVNRAKLMRKAVKVDKKTLRKLEQNQEFEVTGDYSIQFNQCISLKTQAPDEDYFFGDLYQYSSTGQVVAEKSYVLFNLCETQYCAYEGDEQDSIYMVDLATYMGSLIEYKPNQSQGYCEACQEAQEYCQGGGEEAEEEQEEAEEEEEQGEEENNEEEEGEEEQNEEEGEEEEGEEDEGDRRKLRKLQKKKQRRTRRKLANNKNNFVVVDCDTCAYKNCFEEENEDGNDNGDEQEVNDENTAEWVQGLLECQQEENAWNNYAVYSGFICNDSGTGVEIGVFMDEECETYASMINYKNIIGDDETRAFYYNSQDIVTYPFLNDISCAADPEYITPEEYEEMQNEDNQEEQEENEDEAAEANEYCGNLMGEEALPLYDCNEDGQEDEQEDEVEEGNNYNYDWYSYFLSQNDAENNQAVCKLIQTLEGEYTVVYNSDEESGSGSFYNYGTKGTSTGFGASNTLLLIIAICVALLGLFFIIQSCSTPKTKRNALLENRHS